MQELARAMPVAFMVWAFVVGAIVGSFLNVVIARVPARRSIVSPGSRCPGCGSAIHWYDNIPLLSFVLLRARCRKCGMRISPRYAVVELLTGVLAVAVFRHAGATWTGLGYFVFAATLVALAYIDLETWLLPHEITWPLLALGLVSPLWNADLSWTESAIGAGAGFTAFAAITLFGEKVIKRETMGWGDVWLLAAIGAWLGWPALLPVMLLSAVQGAVVGTFMLALRGGRDPADVPQPPPGESAPPGPGECAQSAPVDRGAAPVDEDWVPPKHAVPYGPFLALAALEYLFFGGRLVAAWNHFMFRLLS